MNILGWLELAIYLIVLLLITKPLGIYLVQVLDTHGKTFLDPVVKPVEKLTYRLFGVDPEREINWVVKDRLSSIQGLAKGEIDAFMTGPPF